MPNDTPPTFNDGDPAAEGDLNSLRNALWWLSGWRFGSKPMARVYSSTNVPLTEDGDWTALTFDTVKFNRGETLLFDAGDPTLFTIPTGGIYIVGACVRTEPTTANKALRIRVNDTTTIVQHDNIGVQTPAFTTINVNCVYIFAANDTVTAEVFQDSGGTINAVVEGETPAMWCLWVAENSSD